MGVTIPSAAGEVKEVYEEISNSLRFNDGDDPYLNRTMAAGTSRRIFTFSTWIKRSTLGSFQYVFTNSPQSSFDAVRINNDDTLDIRLKNNDFTVRTNRVYRDVTAWYHIVVAVDTTQSTDSNRVKIYTNGSLETSLAGTTYPTENYDTSFGVNGQGYQVSANTWGPDQAFDGYMTETHFIDGTAKASTDFGEFDDNGVWIPKRYTGTYGTNGFYLEFKQTGTSANSSGIGADTSGNDNHFTPSNLAATDVTTDTCTNNFATLNPLERTNNITFSEGNTKIVGTSSANYSGSAGTIAPTSGKWYCEVKVTDAANLQIGALIPNTSDIGDATSNADGGMYYHYENIYWQDNNTAIKVVNTSASVGNASVTGGSNSVNTYTTNDIISMALDMDNGRIYFAKNGTYENSGNPASGTNAFSLPTNYADGMTFYAGLDAATAEFNFGNPPYAISSGNTDGKYGNFEYAPPSGYYALCTKRLAEFG